MSAFSSLGADHGFIGSFLDRWRAFPQVSANEPQSPTGLARDVAYVFLRGEAFCQEVCSRSCAKSQYYMRT